MNSRDTIELVGLLMALGVVVAVGARVADAMQVRMRRLMK